MPNKTDKILDTIIKNIDFDKVYDKCFKEINIWNGDLSEKERIELLKNGTLF